MNRMPIGAAVRDIISGWPGKIVKRPAGRHPRGTVHVLFEGTAKMVCAGLVNLTDITGVVTPADAWQADTQGSYEPLSVGGADHV